MLPPKGVPIQLTSYTFLFAFLPVTLLVYWLLPRGVWRLAFLVLASWVFVGWYDWRFVRDHGRSHASSTGSPRS